MKLLRKCFRFPLQDHLIFRAFVGKATHTIFGFSQEISVFFVISSVAIAAFAAKALTAQEKLEKGQSLYEAGDYDKAMNYFLDVFVEGNIDQMNIANEYVVEWCKNIFYAVTDN